MVVASPPNVHREQVEAAIASGAHVLCEKPFAIAATDAWAMADAARTAGRHLLIAFGWNYMTLMTAARDLMRSQDIGRIEYVNIAINVAVRELLIDGTPYNSAVGGVAPQAETFVDPAISGGGTAPVTMSHVFGLGQFLSGLDAVDIHCRTVDAQPGVDLHDVIAAVHQNAVPRIEQLRNRGLFRLLAETLEDRVHVRFRGIELEFDIEAQLPQRGGHGGGIVLRIFQRGGGIAAVADHRRNPDILILPETD